MPPAVHPLTELLSFLDSSGEPYVVFDRQYRVLAANSLYRERMGVDRVVGRCCYEISHHYPVPCDQAGESCPLARSLSSGKRERVLHLHHTPSGEEYVDIELTPVRDASGEIAYFVEKMVAMNHAKGLAMAHGLVGRSPAFQKMLEMMTRVGKSEAVVLLEGESGTGKELVANALHQSSSRAKGPFTTVDCSGIPETLFESELFGHERGAFTGATSRKQGLVEAASGGTLFLDEVGEIPLTMQVKLLRLLETGTYRRVGSTEIRRADIRVISATHRSLREMVEQGAFRADLYYRINVFPIVVPALRDRATDIPLLVESLLGRVAPDRALRRPSLGQGRRGGADRRSAAGSGPRRRSRLRRPSRHRSGARPRRRGSHPHPARPQGPTLRRSGDLPTAQPGRALLLQAQALQADRNPLRQARQELPRCRPARLNPTVAQSL